jgi:hypothetical protein
MARQIPTERATRRRGPTPISDKETRRPLLDIQMWVEPPFSGIDPAGWGAVIYAEDGRTPEELEAEIDAAFRELRARIDRDLGRARAALKDLG